MGTIESSAGFLFNVNIASGKKDRLTGEDTARLKEDLSIQREEPIQEEVLPESKKSVETIATSERTREYINKFEDFLAAAAEMKEALAQKLKDHNVTIPPNQDPAVREAIRRLFGRDSYTITAAMFEQCLQWRSEIVAAQRKKTYGEIEDVARATRD